MSRIHYPDCIVRVEASSLAEAFDCDDAEVWIEGEMILISYFDDEGIVVLEGRPDGGSWRLSARSRPRQAFLRRIDEDNATESERDITGDGVQAFSSSIVLHGPGMRFVGEIDEGGECAAWSLVLGDVESP